MRVLVLVLQIVQALPIEFVALLTLETCVFHIP
jgi:hypothetical protein